MNLLKDRLALFERIAREHLGIETLKERGRDALDFHDVGVASLTRALAAAYEAGLAQGLQAPAQPHDQR